MAESIITVKRRTGFTVLPNSTLRDKRLSLKTRAILAIMVSMPDDWDYTVSGLASVCGAGKDAVRSALRELEDGGYLTRVQLHDDAGHFSRNEYIVTDEPTGEGDTPLSENPLTGEPLTGNPTQQNKDCTNTPYSPPDRAMDPSRVHARSNSAQPLDAAAAESTGDGVVVTNKKPSRRRRGPKAAPDWKPERFAGFWEYYPRGENKQGAIRAWDRLQPSDELIDLIARALRRQMESDSWRAGVGIPYASTWLNNRRWEDEVKDKPAADPSAPAWADDPEVM